MPSKIPGATDDDIFYEPDWTKTHSHRIGLYNRDDRFPGLTHAGDDWRSELEEEAEEKIEQLREKVERGELLTVRDYLAKQQDFHLRRPEVHPEHWRYVLHTTENHIKEGQPWLINEKKRKEAETKQREQQRRQDSGVGIDGAAHPEDESKKYTPEEQALLDSLLKERDHFLAIKPNDGKGSSPFKTGYYEPGEIDEADQLTPDNWVPRSGNLIRLTGKHPLNGEPPLTQLVDAGLITPNWLHFVRSHGPVPHLLWENHKLEISAGRSLTVFMDDLREDFDSVNIPAILACDGNRRKELNMIRRSKGFNWGPGGVSCAYWKGALLRDVLLKADIMPLIEAHKGETLWVNFQGSENLSEGKYETCLSLDYVMDPTNDVLLAYAMNDRPLPPDHGYPVRLLVPGFVGGRSVKWLGKIWITNKENDSHYHVYDNRVVPSFVTDRYTEIGKALYNHPSTACMEQVLNSVIARPEHGEKLDVADISRGKSTYHLQGIAYNGGGMEIQRVEVSLDGGSTWLYCIRQYPDKPLRHGRKYWPWLHWHLDIDAMRFLRAESIMVRCWNANKNTQPEKPTWNLEGMMNNCIYTVKLELVSDSKTGKQYIMFRHPCEPGTGQGGWMKPAAEDQVEDMKRDGSTPDKQFTREEIEKHRSADDCWIVVNGKVYDATSVLSWHPGGSASIMPHAGRVHAETTEEFESIHDDFAHEKLQECIIGVATQKTQDFIKYEEEQKAKERAESIQKDSSIALRRHKWVQAKLISKKRLSEDTSCYTFALPSKDQKLGLATGQHLFIGFHFKDRMVFRSYTPTRPVSAEEEDGTFDLVVKTYAPSPAQPGGTMSNILDCIEIGEEVEIKGPTGEIQYEGNGKFLLDGKKSTFDRITLVLGGSGITPGYQVLSRILKSGGKDKTRIRVVDANKTEQDILLREELDRFAQLYPDQFEVTHVLSEPDKSWKGEKGFVNKDILHRYCFPPDEKSIALLCGPPGLVQHAVLPVLLEWGYSQEHNLFGF